MRPRLLTILLLLLAGAVVNVGVAWGCAWFVPVGHRVGILRQLIHQLEEPLVLVIGND